MESGSDKATIGAQLDTNECETDTRWTTGSYRILRSKWRLCSTRIKEDTLKDTAFKFLGDEGT